MSLPETVHGTAVLLGSDGVLIRGPSGSGKSALALQLIDRDPETTKLIADDRVILSVRDGRLFASAPEDLAGKLEIRGQGIASVDHVPAGEVRLIVDLLPPEECPRLPQAFQTAATVARIAIQRLMLPLGSADGAARIRAALRYRTLDNG
jgi:HPr kinase/phosphorylase